MLLFDVVIPTFNNLNELKNCLDSFSNQTIKDYRIYVCVDGSTDGTVEYLKQVADINTQLFFLEHSDQRNHGRGAALNLALPYLSAKYILFIDSDFVVKNSFLQDHFELLKKKDVVSMGLIVYQKGNIWRDYDVTRGLHQFKTDFAVLPFNYMVTSNTAMPSNIFSDLKGFDEKIIAYGGEDTDLAIRIWDRFQIKTILNKKAAVFGKLEKPLLFALKQREEFAKNNLKYIMEKHPNAPPIFRSDRIQSFWGKTLFRLIPQKALLRCAESAFVPQFLKLRIVHLLVFYHLCRGLYSKS